MAKYEYKVMSHIWPSERFQPQALEQELNALAEAGWRVVSSAVTSSLPTLLGKKEELIAILEREIVQLEP